MGYTKMSSGLINKAYNNPINSLTTFAGTHTRRAASPLCPACLRPLLESYVPKGKGMTKEDVKSGSTFASYMASASAAALAYVTMKYLNLAGSPDETGSLLFYGLLYAFIFLAFRFFTSRFCKWLYS